MHSSVDEIKSKLDILQVLQEYLTLKQAGTSWKGLCPFHNEKTPSFFVSPERQVWHCFGCGEGGDLFSFVMRIEGIEFPEALRLLAEKAGVTLRPHDRAQVNVRTRLFDLCRVAMEFFETQLHSNEGEGPRSYVEKRGLTTEIQKRWNIGYAPSSWDALSRFLSTKGFRNAEIVHSGLVVEKPGGRYYDRFRDRIVFPVRDVQGRVVGFGGRLYPREHSKEKQEEPKYVNTPETQLYEKSRILFGLDRAKESIRKEGFAVLVEGYMDVIASHEAGVLTAVATAGTALTSDHIQLLSRYTTTVALSFDMDDAGERASKRSIDLLLQAGFNLRVIELPKDADGKRTVKDPDECVFRFGGKAWEQAVADAQPFVDYSFNRVLEKADLTKGEVKKQVARTLLSDITRLTDTVEQAHYIKKLAQVLDVPEHFLWESLPKKKQKDNTVSAAPAPQTHDRNQRVVERLLSFLLLAPAYISRATQVLTGEMIDDPRGRLVYTTLVILATRDKTYHEISAAKRLSFLEERLPDEQEFLRRLLFVCEQEGGCTDDVLREEIDITLRLLRERHVTRQLRTVEAAMREAEFKKAHETVRELVEQFRHLTDELALLHRQSV